MEKGSVKYYGTEQYHKKERYINLDSLSAIAAVSLFYHEAVNTYFYIDTTVCIGNFLNWMCYMEKYKTIIALGMFSILIICLICTRSKLLSNKYITFVGNVSFEMYLSHMFVFRFIQKLNLCHITKNSLADYIITCVAVVIGAACFSVAAQKYIAFLGKYKRGKVTW